jgi:hypothetical protein
MAGGEVEGGAAAPFLETKPQVYFDGCPGCVMDRRKAENPGIPYRLFFHVWIIIFVSCMYKQTHGLHANSLFFVSLVSMDYIHTHTPVPKGKLIHHHLK